LRLALIGLVAHMLAGCGIASSIKEAIVEKAERTKTWAGCIVDNPPKPTNVAHPSQLIDTWDECANPPHMMLGAVMVVPHTVPRAPSTALE